MFIIDGHNLIPKVPGLSLRDIDDEERLVELLQEYARLKRKKVVVFFDGAPPGQAGERSYGAVRAHFVPAGRTADDAIRQYLDSLGKAARNATVVSSDHLVQANTRELRARVLSSEDFARELSSPSSRQAARSPVQSEPLPDQEVSEWIDLFGLDPARADQPIDLYRKGVKKPAQPAARPEQPAQKKPAEKKKRPHHGFPKKT